MMDSQPPEPQRKRSARRAGRGGGPSDQSPGVTVGFLLGPVYVGLWASATGLRGAMIAVAALGLALAALTLPLLALSRYAVTPRPAACHGDETGVLSAHSRGPV